MEHRVMCTLLTMLLSNELSGLFTRTLISTMQVSGSFSHGRATALCQSWGSYCVETALEFSSGH